MTRLWTFHALPEMRRVLPQRRNALLRFALTGQGGLPLIILSVGLALVPALVGLAAVICFARIAMGGRAVVVAVVLYTLLACFVLYQFLARLMRCCVRAFLRAHCSNGQTRVCLNCGYDLRGTHGPTCPECGAERQVTRASRLDRRHHRHAA